MIKTRIERDSMGELQVPEDALYGAQTQRAVDNFPISGQPMPVQFIRALILAKAAAARANIELKQISETQGNAIVEAAQGLLDGDFMQHFPVDIFQTGSGTSTNMNANEVIAHLASAKLGRKVDKAGLFTNAIAISGPLVVPGARIRATPQLNTTGRCCRKRMRLGRSQIK